jgi:hypothetical protein
LEIVGSMCLRFRAKLTAVLPRIVRAAFHAPSLEEASRRSEVLLDEILAELRSLKKSDLARPKLRVLKTASVDNEDGDQEQAD